MQFTTVALALFGTAMAAPAAIQARQGAQEDANITEFSVHKNAGNAVDGVSFNLLSGAAGHNIVCNANADKVHGLPTSMIDCGDASYHFMVLAGSDATTFTLRLYHDANGVADGIFGHVDIATFCHAGGAGTYACMQEKPASVHLDNSPK
ncbi:hypothetical protein F5Y13DRAFT_195597 [Hypoxylon sp. FL1857]|nr:hypothetical protein F5Y13DRAFT_195597 [Hypoxylon sp. FL1857]